MTTMPKLCATMLLGTLLSASALAIPIAGINDPLNNRAEFDFSVTNPLLLRVQLQNTSNYDARITAFAFDITDGFAAALWSVQGTLDNADWRFSFDALPGPGDRDAFAITGTNFNGGDPRSGIAVNSTGVFDFLGVFSTRLSISNILVRFQRTGADGEGSDRGIACTVQCGPTTKVPEPSSLGLLGVGLVIVGLVARRRRPQPHQANGIRG